MAMWRRFDAGEIGEDFSHIAELGLDTVRVFLRWDDFEPRPDSIDVSMLDRLETVVSLAAEHGVRTMPVLCNGYMCGANWLPEWALDRQSSKMRFPTIGGDREVPFGAKTLYSGPLLDAQLRFAKAVGERLRDHPGVFAWDIGHAFTNVREPARGKLRTGGHETEPAAEREVAEWSSRLSRALKDASGFAATAGTHSADLTEDRNVRLATLCAPFAFASMQGSSLSAGFARNRLDPEAVPFLAMIAAGFSFKPVLVTGFGNPTCPPHKLSLFERFALPDESREYISPDDPLFAAYPCLTEDENAVYCTSVLERLHGDGRLGAYWWCWADYPENMAEEPPFDRNPQERCYGIVRSDGTAKPVAKALSAFAREQRDVVPANDMPMISSAYYYRTLPTSAHTLYEAFLAFIGARRAP
jgi:hypothetical protein